MIVETSRQFLVAMDLVERISANLGTTSWLWGGLVVDVLNGDFLREHDDLDYLTMNLHQLKSQFSELFRKLGWATKNLENGDLKLTKDNIKIHLGHVELLEKAIWTHNGKKGSLIFPISWLPTATIEFYEISVHAVLPELQYVLKTHPHLLNPEWQAREKDILDLEALEKILLNRSAEISSLSELITDI